MQKSEAIQNHKIKPEEAGYYHVMFTKILKVGKRTIDEFHVVLYSEREFRVFKLHTDKNGLNSTGFDEYEVVHRPGEKKAAPKDDKEADEIRAYLTEKGVKFHPKMGLAKLKALKEEN